MTKWAEYEERRDEWLSELDDEQKNKAIRKMLDEFVLMGYVQLRQGCAYPYWTSCGAPVVPGQTIYSHEVE